MPGPLWRTEELAHLGGRGTRLQAKWRAPIAARLGGVMNARRSVDDGRIDPLQKKLKTCHK
jgi:hypothetical protein